jgi:hypothetical protein
MKRNDDMKIGRRTFLSRAAGIGAASVLLPLVAGRKAAAEEGATEAAACTDLNAKRGTYWKEDGKYFVQTTVDPSKLNTGVLKARVDGRWQTFLTRGIDDRFFNFNIKMRLNMINAMLGTSQLQMYNDAHNAAVASYGANRGDSRVTINNAYKGMGWVPTPEQIETHADEYFENATANMMQKIAIIKKNYMATEIWRRDVLGSLELYSRPDFETHTFINVMENPVVSLVFLGDESYEFRAICRLLHPLDPNLTPEDYNLVRWINFAHDFFHGGGDRPLGLYFAAAVYHIIEEFDNSPMGATATAGGNKLVPRM